MKSYRKGSNTERELMKILESKGIACVRVAGSGNNGKPDLIVSNGKKIFAIECKYTSKEYKYVDQIELENFFKFSRKFGVEGWYAIKFKRVWKFIPLISIFGNRKLTQNDGITLNKFFSLLS